MVSAMLSSSSEMTSALLLEPSRSSMSRSVMKYKLPSAATTSRLPTATPMMTKSSRSACAFSLSDVENKLAILVCSAPQPVNGLGGAA
jgi:hypothetical protein